MFPLTSELTIKTHVILTLTRAPQAPESQVSFTLLLVRVCIIFLSEIYLISVKILGKWKLCFSSCISMNMIHHDTLVVLVTLIILDHVYNFNLVLAITSFRLIHCLIFSGSRYSTVFYVNMC